MNRYLLLLISAFLFTTGCDTDLDLITIDQYIQQEGLEVQSTGTGLKYIIEEAGDSDRPNNDSNVLVKYKGYRTDGFVFDSSVNGTTFSLGNLIVGWQEGIALLGRGGKATLFIPSELAYGRTSPSSTIPPNTDLIFDIELLNF